MATVITGIQIELARLVVLKSALKLECLGIRVTRGASAYKIVKKELGLKGSKEAVLKQLEAMMVSSKNEGSA